MDRIYNLFKAHESRLRNLFVLVVCNFSVAAVSFLTNVKIANVLGANDFGLLTFALAIGMYGAGFIGFGFERTLVRDMIHRPNEQAILMQASLVIRTFFMLSLFLVLLYGKFTGFLFANFSHGMIAATMAIALVGMDFQAVFDSRELMGRHACLNLLNKTAYLVLVWSIIMLDSNLLSINLVGYTKLLFAILLICSQVLLLPSIGLLNVNLRSVKFQLLGFLRHNSFVWVSSLISMSFPILTQILIKIFCGASELGIYAASWQVVTIAVLALTQIARVGFPHAAKRLCNDVSLDSRRRFLLKYSAVLFLPALAIALPAIIIPGRIIDLFYDSQYSQASSSMRLLGFYLLVAAFGSAGSQCMLSLKMHKLHFAILAMCLATHVVLALSFIPENEGAGAAMSLLISHGAAMILFYFMVWFFPVSKSGQIVLELTPQISSDNEIVRNH